MNKQDLRKEFYTTLYELQEGNPSGELLNFLKTKLKRLLNCVKNCIDDDFIKQAKKFTE